MRSYTQVAYSDELEKWLVYVGEYTMDNEGKPYWAGYVAGAFDTKKEAEECAKKEEQNLMW